jgi:hypothetical protein
MIIAICTFFLLADYQHQVRWVQGHRILLWSVPWLLPILWAALGAGIDGYNNTGACK